MNVARIPTLLIALGALVLALGLTVYAISPRSTEAGWEIAAGVVLLMAGITLHDRPAADGDDEAAR